MKSNICELKWHQILSKHTKVFAACVLDAIIVVKIWSYMFCKFLRGAGTLNWALGISVPCHVSHPIKSYFWQITEVIVLFWDQCPNNLSHASFPSMFSSPALREMAPILSLSSTQCNFVFILKYLKYLFLNIPLKHLLT